MRFGSFYLVAYYKSKNKFAYDIVSYNLSKSDVNLIINSNPSNSLDELVSKLRSVTEKCGSIPYLLVNTAPNINQSARGCKSQRIVEKLTPMEETYVLKKVSL